MRKLIDLDQNTLKKLKFLSVFENISVKALMENAIESFVKSKENERFSKLNKEEKEDLGMLMLMQEAERTEYVSRDEIMKILKS